MDKELMHADEKRDIEVLEFRAGGNSYGVDIYDIKEILPYNKKIRKIPNSHPCIEGVMMPRDFIIPIINLALSLKLEDDRNNEKPMLLVSSINDLNIGFHVDSVNGIHRTTTANITKPGEKLSTTVKEAIIGVLAIDNRRIEVLEFRNIITGINDNVNLG